MAVLEVPVDTTTLKDVKAVAGQLVEFEQDALRNTLVRAAGSKLSGVAESSARTVTDQINAIRQSCADFDAILERMNVVRSSVDRIDNSIGIVVSEAEGSSRELGGRKPADESAGGALSSH